MKRHNELSVVLTEVLTPKTCVTVLHELLKYILYHKEFIPYPYVKLQNHAVKLSQKPLLDLVKDSDHRFKLSRDFFLLERHCDTVKNSYSVLKTIFDALENEILNSGENRLEEVVLAFGNSLCPSYVITIRMPSIDFQHFEANHCAFKSCEEVFKSVFNADEFFQDANAKSSCAYMLVKMHDGMAARCKSLVSRPDFEIPPSSRHTIITLKSSEISLYNEEACRCFKVYQDENPSQDERAFTTSEYNRASYSPWYQIKDTITSFQDVKIRGVLASNLWHDPELFNNF